MAVSDCSLFMLRRPSSSGLDSITHHNGSWINPVEFNESFSFGKAPVKCVRISGDHDVSGGLCVFMEIKLE